MTTGTTRPNQMTTGTPRPGGGQTIYITTIAGRKWFYAAPADASSRAEIIEKEATE